MRQSGPLGGFAKVATQFRKYQIMQITLLARLLHSSFKGATPEERAVARRTLGWVAAHVGVMGGALGLPAANILGYAMGLVFGGKDEPWDEEVFLRKAIGNKHLSDLLLRGVPKALGVDMSTKIGLGQTFSVLPYTDIDYSKKGFYELFGATFGGASVSLGARAFDGVSMIRKGDYYKGLEQLLPMGIANTAKGARLATQGLSQRNGDIVMRPDEINFLDGLMQAVGLPTNTIKDRQFRSSAMYDMDTKFKERVSDIKRKYVSGDKAEALKEWRDLQEAQRKNGFKPSELSSLIKAPQEKAKREASAIGGLTTNKRDVGAARTLAEL